MRTSGADSINIWTSLSVRFERDPRLAARAVLEASRRLHRPVDALSIEDIDRVKEGIQVKLPMSVISHFDPNADG